MELEPPAGIEPATSRLQPLCVASALVRGRLHARSYVHARARQCAAVRHGCCQRCCRQPVRQRLRLTPVGGRRTQAIGRCHLVAGRIDAQVPIVFVRRTEATCVEAHAAFLLPVVNTAGQNRQRLRCSPRLPARASVSPFGPGHGVQALAASAPDIGDTLCVGVPGLPILLNM